MSRQLTSKGKVVIVAVVGVIAVSLFSVSLLKPSNPASALKVGDAAPNFTLYTSDGGSVVLSAYRGSKVVLEFMSPFCSFCVDQAPALASLYRTHSDASFVSVVLVQFPDGVATDPDVNQFRTQYGTPWPYAMDVGTNSLSFGGPVTASYGVNGTPTTFIIDAQGAIMWIGKGVESLATLEGVL